MTNDQRLRLLPTNPRNPSTIFLHVIGHRVTTDDFQMDTLVPSMYRDQKLRLNKFNNGVSNKSFITVSLISTRFRFNMT
jgi:hypothetical protein